METFAKFGFKSTKLMNHLPQGRPLRRVLLEVRLRQPREVLPAPWQGHPGQPGPDQDGFGEEGAAAVLPRRSAEENPRRDGQAEGHRVHQHGDHDGSGIVDIDESSSASRGNGQKQV